LNIEYIRDGKYRIDGELYEMQNCINPYDECEGCAFEDCCGDQEFYCVKYESCNFRRLDE